jgi:hypothetical protein
LRTGCGRGWRQRSRRRPEAGWGWAGAARRSGATGGAFPLVEPAGFPPGRGLGLRFGAGPPRGGRLERWRVLGLNLAFAKSALVPGLIVHGCFHFSCLASGRYWAACPMEPRDFPGLRWPDYCLSPYGPLIMVTVVLMLPGGETVRTPAPPRFSAPTGGRCEPRHSWSVRHRQAPQPFSCP